LKPYYVGLKLDHICYINLGLLYNTFIMVMLYSTLLFVVIYTELYPWLFVQGNVDVL